MQVADQAHAVSFSRFLDSDEEDCVYDISNTAVRSSTCTHCRSQIYESTSAQSWQVSLITFFLTLVMQNERGTLVTLCSKCNQKYISGLVDSASEHRKFAKQIQLSCGKIEPIEQTSKQEVIRSKPPQNIPAAVQLATEKTKISFETPKKLVVVAPVQSLSSQINLGAVDNRNKCQEC